MVTKYAIYLELFQIPYIVLYSTVYEAIMSAFYQINAYTRLIFPSGQRRLNRTFNKTVKGEQTYRYAHLSIPLSNVEYLGEKQCEWIIIR